MPSQLNDKSALSLELKSQIIDSARFFFQQGLLPATSGNLSARLGDEIIITVSGLSKGRLSTEDFTSVDMTGNLIDPNPLAKASAETLLHTQIYQAIPEARFVFHVHSFNSVVLSRRYFAEGQVSIYGYELLKALAGVTTHDHTEILPIFANTQDIAKLAKEVDEYMHKHSNLHAYLIEGHGLYTWGRNYQEALRHIEALEVLFQLKLEEKK